jgi:hypothetical protein
VITYHVDEDKKIITCTIEGDEVADCPLNKLDNLLKAYSNNMIYINGDALKLSKSYTGIAKYDEEDENEFDIAKGKVIARKKAFAKLNQAMAKRFKKIMKNAQYLYENALCNVFEYETTTKEIQKKINQY